MTQLSRMAIVSALAQGRPEDIKGTAENAWLDFKRTPYPVQTDRGKFDLAKDVAAFANAQGGLLVCGISTIALENEAKDVADEVMPFPIDQAKVQSCRDVINRLVKPPANVNDGTDAVITPATSRSSRPYNHFGSGPWSRILP